jgi:hypothetical protein
MSDFELVLDECLTQLASGASSLDEILARHPEHAAQLSPLLQAALRFDVAQNVQPSPAFKARARGQLTNYMKVHPRRRSWAMIPIWRVALSAAVLAIAFLITSTAFAQSALPAQALYAWKLSSETVWRTLAPDSVAVDLILADRRVDEMIAVAGNPVGEAQALNGYLEVLARLKYEKDAQNGVQILQSLKSQQAKLSQSGISVPELNQIFVPSSLKPSLPTIVPTNISPLLPKTLPTVKIPPLLP